jgi:hypothetical protein
VWLAVVDAAGGCEGVPMSRPPASAYDVDDIAVERACHGDYDPRRLNPAERAAAVRILASRGVSKARTARLLRLTERHIARLRNADA